MPIVGMLGWIVHTFVHANLLTPTYILVLFIVATLALAWTIFTVISYLRARHDALFIAVTDLAFMGAFIAGVVLLKFVAKQSCSNVGDVFHGINYGSRAGKFCGLMKASFAFGIIAILSFAVTFVRLHYFIQRLGKSNNANFFAVPSPTRTSPSPKRR